MVRSNHARPVCVESTVVVRQELARLGGHHGSQIDQLELALPIGVAFPARELDGIEAQPASSIKGARVPWTTEFR